jgi:hypothetical protein
MVPPFFTSALEVSGQLHVSAVLTPENYHQVLIGYEPRWTPELVWTL